MKIIKHAVGVKETETETLKRYNSILKMDLKQGKSKNIGKKLGSGAFGEDFIIIDNVTDKEVVFKVESNRIKHSQLLHETKLSRNMKE